MTQVAVLLPNQTQGVLTTERGGTSNDMGGAICIGERWDNTSGSSIAAGSIVRKITDGTWAEIGVEAVDDDTATDVLGVMIGKLVDNRVLPIAIPDKATGYVATFGIAVVLVSEDVSAGDYAIPTTTSGQAGGSASFSKTAFGIFAGTGASGGSATVRMGVQTQFVAGSFPTASSTGSASDIVNNSKYNAFPGVTVLHDKTWLLGYRAATDHQTTHDGTLDVTIGTPGDDGTMSWATPSTLVSATDLDVRCSNPLSTLSDGRTALVYETWNGSNTLLGRKTYVSFLNAGDDPTDISNWSTAVQITGHGFTTLVVPGGPVVEAPDGTLLLPVYGRSASSGDTSAKVVRSSDDFVTQTATTIASGTVGSGSNWTEPFITVLDDGQLLCSIREDTDRDIYSSRSLSPDGSAWTTASLDHDGYGQPFTMQAYSGALLRIYRESSSNRAVYRLSYDRGLTWDTETGLETTIDFMVYATGLQVGTTIHAIYGLEISSTNADIVTRPLVDITDARFAVGRSGASTASAGGPAGGDLSGTYPDPTVAQVNGIAFSGTPSVGQVPTATSTTAATWQTPRMGSGEQLVEDGVSAPPVTLTNEDADDWLYADV